VHDIETRADIDEILRAFYNSAFADGELGHIFTDVAHMDVDAHLPVIGNFWEKVLLNTDVYRGNAMRVHQDLHHRFPLTSAHFDRWLELWSAAVDDRFAGPIADQAKAHAVRISAAMLRNLDRLPHEAALSPRSLPMVQP
jgi:hemoglobin